MTNINFNLNEINIYGLRLILFFRILYDLHSKNIRKISIHDFGHQETERG